MQLGYRNKSTQKSANLHKASRWVSKFSRVFRLW